MRVTIVTVALNPGAEIDRTVEAVARQDHHDLQWVVIDGGSSDGTPARLRALGRPPDILISEPDAGIADAFNKGLRWADGAGILFLNAGDALARVDAISRLSSAWRPERSAWITAGVSVRDHHGREIYRRIPAAEASARLLLARRCLVAHPATLVDTVRLREAGGFDVGFRCAMDYDLWLRLWRRGLEPQVLPEALAVFHLGGRSLDPVLRAREDRLARERNGLGAGVLVEAGRMLRARSLGMLGCLRRSRTAMRLKEWMIRT